jgi:hypothetical protein
MPSRHDITLRLDHMVHDSRFWGFVTLLALIAALIVLGILAAIFGEANPNEIYMLPYPYDI